MAHKIPPKTLADPSLDAPAMAREIWEQALEHEQRRLFVAAERLFNEAFEYERVAGKVMLFRD